MYYVPQNLTPDQERLQSQQLNQELEFLRKEVSHLRLLAAYMLFVVVVRVDVPDDVLAVVPGCLSEGRRVDELIPNST